MAYNNTNGRSNNGAQTDINTNSLILFYNNMALRIDLYNKNLSIGLIRAVQTSEGKNTFPKDSQIRVLLTPERVTALNEIIQNGLIPALQSRNSYSHSLITNVRMSSVISVGCDMDGNVYLDIYTDMDERRIPKKSARYVFPKTATLSRFNPQTGEYEQGESIQAQFYLVARCLEDFLYSSSMAGAHNQKMLDSYSNRRIMNILQEIAIKLGINIQKGSSDGHGYRYGGSSNGGSYNGSASHEASPAPTETNVTSLDNMDDPDLPF